MNATEQKASEILTWIVERRIALLSAHQLIGQDLAAGAEHLWEAARRCDDPTRETLCQEQRRLERGLDEVEREQYQLQLLHAGVDSV